jgi:hypothetical protein
MSEQGSRNDYVRVQEWLRGRLRLLAGRQRRMHRRDDRLVWCESQPGWKSTNCSTSANDVRERSECRYARFGVQVRLNAAAMVLSRAAFESRYLS